MEGETVPLTRETSKSAASDGWFRDGMKKRQSVFSTDEGEAYDTSMLQSLAKVSVQFENLHFEVPDNAKKGATKTIIHNMTGVIPQEQMTAIMGPSGSGKTTLMDMIADTKTMPYTGEVYVNGFPRARGANPASAAFAKARGYVAQIDDANGFTTVRETFNFHAMLRPPTLSSEVKADIERWHHTGMEELENESAYSAARNALHIPANVPLSMFDARRVIRRAIVDLVLKMLDLTPFAETKIGNAQVPAAVREQSLTVAGLQIRGLSGGQKKRMAIGRALVSAPAILFLDEPTTGLSSTDSYKVMHEIQQKLVIGMGITVVRYHFLCCLLIWYLCCLCYCFCLLVDSLQRFYDCSLLCTPVNAPLAQVGQHLMGCNQVAVIHQPRNSVFDLFDRFICVCDGKMVYQGDRRAATNYFAQIGIGAKFVVDAHSNPADFFIDAITTNTKVVLTNPDGSTKESLADPDLFKDEYGIDYTDLSKDRVNLALEIEKEVELAKRLPGQGNMSAEEYDLTVVFSDHVGTTGFFQFTQLLKRDLKVAARDPARLFGRAMNGTCLGLMIGALYKDVPTDQFANWLLINLQMPAVSTMVSMPVFYQERPFMNLERDSGLYTTAPYFLANMCSLFLVSLVGNLSLMTIAFAFSGWPWEAYVPLWGIATLLYVAMDSLLVMCVMNTKDQNQGLAFFNGILGIFFLFNGLTANTNISPPAISWLCFISPIYYALELGMTMGSKCDGFNDEDQAIIKNITTGSGTGQLDMKDDAAARDVFLILSIGLVARLFAYYCCDTKNRVTR